MLLDKLSQKILENVVSACMPDMAALADKRKLELAEIKSNIRTNPGLVEEWFDKELRRIENIDPKNILELSKL